MIRLLALIRLLPGVAFVVAVESGRIIPYAPRELPLGFMSSVQDKIDRGGLATGLIFGKKQQGGLTLGFLGIPKRLRQPLLNSWHVHKERYI